MVLLLYWRGKDPSGSFNLFAPLYYNSQTEDEQVRILLPFHYLYRSLDSESRLWALYFFKKSPQRTTRALFPFYLNTVSPESKNTMVALYFSQKNPKLDSKFIFPLFWSFHFHEPDKKSYQALLPFYLRISEEKNKSSMTISPFFWSSKNPALSQGLLPPYYWRRSLVGATEVGFPIYWRFMRKKEGRLKDIQIAVPWFRVRSDQNSFRGFFPLYWGRTKTFEEEHSASSLPPAETARETAPGRVSLKQTRWNLFIPLFLSSKKPDGSSKIITPLFSRFHDEDGKEYGHSGLNFFTREVWGGKLEGLFPFFYYREESDFYKFRFLTFYIERDQKEEHSSTSLFPLFRYRRDSDRKQFLTPFYYRDKDPDSSRGFFISYFWKNEYADGGARVDSWTVGNNCPTVNSGTFSVRKRFLVPLVWYFRSESQKTVIVPPVVAFHSRPEYRLSLVLPFYFQREKEKDKLTIIPPLIARSSPDQKWGGLFFLFWQSTKGNKSSIAFYPLYRRSKFPNGYSILLPGLYFLREGSETQGVAGPYLWDHRGKTQYEILPPVYWHFKRPAWRVKTFLPFYTFQTKTWKEEGFFPLWAKTDSVAVATDTPKHFLENSHRFLPFYFYRKLEDGSDLFLPFLLARIEKGLNENKQKMVRGRLLLLNYWEKSSDSIVNRFDPLYSYHRSAESKGFSVPTVPFPLWQYERHGLLSDEDKIVRGAFFPYYWKVSRTDRRHWVIPLFYRRVEKSPTDQKEIKRVTWLLTYYSKQDEISSDKKTFFIPFYWHFSTKDESRTVLPPFWTERGPNFKKDIFFPFWWNFQRDHETLAVLFPFYMKSFNPKENRTMTVLPGYWSLKDTETSSFLAFNYYQKSSVLKNEKSSVFFPIFWAMQAPDRTTLSAFPFFWKWRSGARSITYFFPLYFQHQRPGYTWNILFPVFWNIKTGETNIRVAPPYFSIDSKSTQTKTTGFAPLWSYSRNLKEGWKNFQVLGGLVGFEKKGEKRTLTLLYLIRIGS